MRLHLLFLLAVVPAAPAAAQEWNAPEVRELVQRAVARRAGTLGPGGLNDYRATARGFVLFLTQLGSGFVAPPVLAKTDQLVLEVYWQAPGRSKQMIVGWRDRMDLPTEIRYHRDHLGIVQNSFGDRIRLGDGHEVRDVAHPLAPDGPATYEYAAVDSIRIAREEGILRVLEVRVRPRRPDDPGVVGSIFLEAESAEVVRFRFGFTRAAYRDDTVEDITVALEHALWDGRYWLPREQQIEIRRRTGWLDFPARGIIRASWRIDDYRFNLGFPAALFAGREIVPLPPAVRDTFGWARPLADDLDAWEGPRARLDLEAVREELRAVVSRQLLSGLPATGVGGRGVSDFLRFNRVEGVRLGGGGVARPRGTPLEVRGWAGYGVSDRRVTARLEVAGQVGAWRIVAEAAREVRDFLDQPVVSPLLNSLTAQEGGIDHGDYLLAERVGISLGRPVGSGRWTGSARVERVRPVSVAARPVRGSFRPNPVFGPGTWHILGMEWTPAALRSSETGGRVGVGLEAGRGAGRSYGRLTMAAHLQVVTGVGRGVVRGRAGWGTRHLPAHRAFAFGGRGTLVGERFRAWGGRAALWGTAEWQFAIPVPALGFGPVASTGDRVTLAPFLGAGWAGPDGRRPGVSWTSTEGARPVAGVAIEWLRGLLRWELGWSVRDGAFRGAVDVRRDLWGIL